jgi:hypothetical protein
MPGRPEVLSWQQHNSAGSTTDGRNLEAAKEVYERFLNPIVNQP